MENKKIYPHAKVFIDTENNTHFVTATYANKSGHKFYNRMGAGLIDFITLVSTGARVISITGGSVIIGAVVEIVVTAVVSGGFCRINSINAVVCVVVTGSETASNSA
jgi:hypothetical protein